MISDFLTVGQQVLILFILIGVGVLLGKTKTFTDIGIKNITDFVLYVVCPCVIIDAFQREFDKSELKNLLITALLSVTAHLIPTLIAYLVIHDKDEARTRVLRFGSVFSNCGFMSLPLQAAILGNNGVFYGAIFVAVFNLSAWSYGLIMMSGDRKQMSPKKIITNPGIIGVVIGLILFFCSVQLPEVAAKPISYFAALNTPVPMLIIGYHLSKTNILSAMKDGKMYLTLFIRLLLSPLIMIAIMYAFNIDRTIFIACTIASAAPTAAITTMFSAKYNRATGLSVDLVSIGTLLSLITLPLTVGLAQCLA